MKSWTARRLNPARPRRATGPVTMVVAGLLALSTAACSGAAQSSSFLARTASQLLFLQWSRAGSQLSGSLLMSSTSTTPPSPSPSPLLPPSPSPSGSVSPPAGTPTASPSSAAIAVQSDQFAGRIDGRSVRLSFERDIGMGTRWSGVLDGSRLTMSYTPEGAATPVRIDFRSTTPDAYNRELLGLTGPSPTPSFANPAAARAAIDRAAAAVRSDLRTLTAAVSRLNGDVQAIDGGLATMRADVAAAKAQNAVARSHKATPGQRCAAAAAAAGDAGQAAAANAALSAAMTRAKADFAAVAVGSQRLATDFGMLQSDRVALPSYRPSGIPAQTEVTAAAQEAGKVLALARPIFPTAPHQAASLLSQVQVVAQSAQAGCSGG